MLQSKRAVFQLPVREVSMHLRLFWATLYRKPVRIILIPGSGYDIPHDPDLFFNMAPEIERFAGIAVTGLLPHSCFKNVQIFFAGRTL